MSCGGERVHLGSSLSPVGQSGEAINPRCRENLEELRQLVLGFDVDPADTARVLSEWSEFCELPVDSNEIRQREDDILNIFVDICSLFERRPSVEDPVGC